MVKSQLYIHEGQGLSLAPTQQAWRPTIPVADALRRTELGTALGLSGFECSRENELQVQRERLCFKGIERE